MAAMANPTPAPGAYILPKRQNALSTFISDISSVFDPPATTSDGSGNTATTDDGSGGTTSTPTTTSSSSVYTPTTSSSSRQRTRTSDTGTTTTADSGSGSSDSGSGNSFVTTQVSTQQGGGTVVIVRTTRSAAAATNTAGSDTSSTSSSNGGKIGGIVGGVVGGLALITAALLLFFLWRRRKSRTGSGYFLCFGRRPDRNNKDFDVNWPTFDPTLGSAAVGGTMGARSGQNNHYNAHGGTLPDVEDGDAYSPDEDMREIGSNGQSSYGAYYGAGAAAGAAAVAPSAYSSNPHTGANSTSYKGPSEEGHYRNGGVGTQGWGAAAPTSDDTAPTYDHLDPPEVREARAREQAQAQAQAMAAYSAGGEYSPPFVPSQPAPAYYQSASPPLPSNRLSTGSTQALANGMYMDEGEGTLEPQSDHQQRMLHLHNPDGY